MHLSLEKELPFMIHEADFWFEHAEDIYTGKITRNDLYLCEVISLLPSPHSHFWVETNGITLLE